MKTIANRICVYLIIISIPVMSLAVFNIHVDSKVSASIKPISEISETTNWLTVGNRMIDFKIIQQKDKRWLAKIKIQEIGKDRIDYKTIGQYNTLNKAEEAASMIMTLIEEQHLTKMGSEIYGYAYDRN